MKIVLDAGHGYNTQGKRSPDGLKEYEINRSIAIYTKDILQTYQDVTVIFSHNDDRDVALKERTTIANIAKADCFVSIHANAAGNGVNWHDANGIETFIFTSGSAKSRTLAETVQKNLIAATGLRNRGVKTANFQVLRETKMPAILIECGFMTSQSEVKLLRSETYRKTCAEAIAKSIIEVFKLQKAPQVAKPTTRPSTQGIYKVQVGAFHSKQNADALAEKLKSQGYEPYIIFEKQ